MTTGGLIVFAATWAALLWHAGSMTWAVTGAIVILMSYALVLAIEFGLLWLVHGDDPAPRASLGALLRAWVGEVAAAARVFCWRQPFRSNAEPDYVPTAHGGDLRGVVFVHGLLCNRGFWNPWMARFRRRRVPFIAVNLEPAFESMDRYPPIVDDAVALLRSTTGLAPVIVAHSMGGLVARAWMVAFGARMRVHRIVTIAAPHRGTWLAKLGQAPSSREMCVDSPWLQRLRRLEDMSDDAHGGFTCFYGNCDNIVFPASTATLPGADNRSAHGSAHVEMAFREDVYEAVLGWLNADADADADADASTITLAASARDRLHRTR